MNPFQHRVMTNRQPNPRIVSPAFIVVVLFVCTLSWSCKCHKATAWVPPSSPARSTTIAIRSSRLIRIPPVTTGKIVLIPARRDRLRVPSSVSASPLFSSDDDDDDSSLAAIDPRDQWYSSSSTTAAVGAQSALIPLALVGAAALHLDVATPGDAASLSYGLFSTLPLIGWALVLDRLEPQSTALQQVTAAVNRSVYQLLGGTFKPLLAVVTAVTLGLVAGLGEELLFRGVLQNVLIAQSSSTVLGVLSSSLLFGLLHAVTPMYVVLTTMASIYFGSLYIWFDMNLTIPIVCHAVYDVGALLYAHYIVSRLSMEELQALLGVEEGSSATDL